MVVAIMMTTVVVFVDGVDENYGVDNVDDNDNDDGDDDHRQHPPLVNFVREAWGL